VATIDAMSAIAYRACRVRAFCISAVRAGGL
jgi:hypothetical protein